MSYTLRDDTDTYQLVTWSKDQSLRIWKIEPGLQETVGQEFEDEEGEEEEEEDSDDLDNVSTGEAEQVGRLALPRSEDERDRAMTADTQR